MPDRFKSVTNQYYRKLCSDFTRFFPTISIPFNAITLLAGFMIALSAEIGLRMGLLGSFMSMITTCACSPTFSLIQMNLSDSIVRVLNPMFAGLMPRFWSWKRRSFGIKLLPQHSHREL